MGASINALQYFFVFHKQDGIIKDLKLEILICFNSPINKHLTPVHQTPHIFPIPVAIEQFFWCWKWSVEGYKCLFS
jgi:hypothetical protein